MDEGRTTRQNDSTNVRAWRAVARLIVNNYTERYPSLITGRSNSIPVGPLTLTLRTSFAGKRTASACVRGGSFAEDRVALGKNGALLRTPAESSSPFGYRDRATSGKPSVLPSREM